MENIFKTLSAIDCNDKVEKKNNLTYLSWAWAWAELKKKYPLANSKVYETEQGINYFNDGKTAWVKVGVTINDLEHIEYLPVMDYRNKSIGVDTLTSFDVNKAIQRATTKAIARHGLGLYIYAGEDLPELTQLDVKDIEPIKEKIAQIEDVDSLQILYKSLEPSYQKNKLVASLFTKAKIKLSNDNN